MFDDSQYRTARLLVRLGNAVTYYRNQKLRAFDLTSVQGDAIRCIFHQPGITAAELKIRLGLSQSTIAGILARLEDKGLVERKAVDGDARKLSLVPTEKSLPLKQALQSSALESQRAITEGMAPEEREEFDRLLEIALTNMNLIREEGRMNYGQQ